MNRTRKRISGYPSKILSPQKHGYSGVTALQRADFTDSAGLPNLFIERPLWPNHDLGHWDSSISQCAGTADTMRLAKKASIACATDPTDFDRQLSDTRCSRSLLFET